MLSQLKYDADTAVLLASPGKFGTIWFCLTCIIYLHPAPIKSVKSSLPGKLSLLHTLAGTAFDFLYYSDVNLPTTFSFSCSTEAATCAG